VFSLFPVFCILLIIGSSLDEDILEQERFF
jgi:hypothetical protein